MMPATISAGVTVAPVVAGGAGAEPDRRSRSTQRAKSSVAPGPECLGRLSERFAPESE